MRFEEREDLSKNVLKFIIIILILELKKKFVDLVKTEKLKMLSQS